MKRAFVPTNRRVASIRGLGLMACAAAALALAPLIAPAQRVIVAPSFSTSHGWTYTSPSGYSSHFDTSRISRDNSCAYFGSYGYHRPNCGCGYSGGIHGRHIIGRRDPADTYYQRRRQEDFERRVRELKREEEIARDRQERKTRLELERRERMERIAQLRADPKASAPKVYGYANPTVDEAVMAYFVYHQKTEARTITGSNGTLAGAKPAPAPAAGLTAIGVDDWTYYYKEGQFYTLEGETLTPIAAPLGALVFNIPDDCRAVSTGKQPIYECKGTYFQYTFIGDKPMYEVVPQPNVMADAKTY